MAKGIEMSEIWDERLHEILGNKKCSLCGKKLQMGKNFILKERKFFHEQCYRKIKAKQIREGKVKIDRSVENAEKRLNRTISKSSFGEETN